METTLPTPSPRFARAADPAPPHDPAAERLAALLARENAALREERAARKRAERTAAELARMVARAEREAASARARRERADEVAAEMAALVAREHARAEAAEDRARAAQTWMLEAREGRAVRRSSLLRRALGG